MNNLIFHSHAVKCGHLSAFVKRKRPLLFDLIADDNPHMEKNVLNIIRQAIDGLGLSNEDASKKCGLERSYFRKLFERGTTPKVDTALKISAGLNIPIELLSDKGAARAARAADKSSAPAPITLPDRRDMPNDVPVMGTAAGSHLRGAFQMTTDPIDYVRRPPALMGARDIYSLFVEGESMIPQYYPADLIFISPHKPVKVGDPVVIQCQMDGNSTVEATLGVFLKRTAEKITIQKHNPQAEIELLRSTIISMQKVLTMNELFGI